MEGIDGQTMAAEARALDPTGGMGADYRPQGRTGW